jgi:TrmH family RNA methyltransferase
MNDNAQQAFDNIRVVLVDPIYPGNVGAVCRAMANCGLSRLAIAESTHEIDTVEGRKRSMHAEHIFNNRSEHATLADAVADCTVIAGTSAREGLYRSHSKTAREWAPVLFNAARDQKVALVFGTEDKGLRNEHLGLCTHIIQIPSHPEYSSLNLSHAVMVCCYEIYVASEHFEPNQESSPEASSEMRERLFEVWRKMMLDIGFMKEDKADHMMYGLRRIFSRGIRTLADLKILMGIARQAEWCAADRKRVKAEKSE